MKQRVRTSRFCHAIALAGLLSGFTPAPSRADTPPERHGIIEITTPGVQVEGGLTLTRQVTDAPGTHDESLASFDLVSIMPWQTGFWTLYVEGTLTPRADGVFRRLPGVNADAGTALDRDGAGRLQVSELRYSRRFGRRLLSVGLIAPTDMLDNSAVANDETRQFLHQALVNNPGIAFPDYTLGLSWHRDIQPNRFDVTAFLGSSHGLADNPDASYAQLIDIRAPGKGLFAAVETYWTAPGTLLRLGLWYNGAAHPRLDAPAHTAPARGVYTVFDFTRGDLRWMLRAGLADARVSRASRFLSLAVDRSLGDAEIGAGLAWTGLSPREADPEQADEGVAEGYLRLPLPENLELTASLQRVVHPGLRRGGTAWPDRAWISSLRLVYPF